MSLSSLFIQFKRFPKEYFRSLPFNDIEHVEHTGTDFHVVRVGAAFFAPSRFDDEIEVHVRTGRIGRSSLTFLIEIFPKDGETPLVKSDVAWVNTDQTSIKLTPLPEKLVLKLREKEESGI